MIKFENRISTFDFRFYVFLLLFITIAPVHAWGTTAHRIIHEKAIEAVPDGNLKRFLTAHREYLVSNAVLPDRLRNHDEEEGPRHYIDLEYYGGYSVTDDPPSVPPPDAEYEWGVVPWHIGVVFDSLVTHIRRRESFAALRTFAVLGHYITDAHVPLHTTVNHDGQLTGNKGIHSRWESRLVEHLEEEIRAMPAVFSYMPNRSATDEAWRYVRGAHPQIQRILASDSAATEIDPDFGDAYYEALADRERAHLFKQLDLSTRDLAGVWQKAWEKAGDPEIERVLLTDLSMERGSIRATDTATFWTIRWDDVGTVPLDSAVLKITIREGGRRKTYTVPVFAGQSRIEGYLPRPPQGPLEIIVTIHASGDVEPGNNEGQLTARPPLSTTD